MKCIKCKEPISEGRLKALPETKTCVACSTTSAWYLRNIVTGNNEYMESEIIKDPKLAERLKEIDAKGGGITRE